MSMRALSIKIPKSDIARHQLKSVNSFCGTHLQPLLMKQKSFELSPAEGFKIEALHEYLERWLYASGIEDILEH